MKEKSKAYIKKILDHELSRLLGYGTAAKIQTTLRLQSSRNVLKLKNKLRDHLTQKILRNRFFDFERDLPALLKNIRKNLTPDIDNEWDDPKLLVILDEIKKASEQDTDSYIGQAKDEIDKCFSRALKKM